VGANSTDSTLCRSERKGSLGQGTRPLLTSPGPCRWTNPIVSALGERDHVA
jgi:hypothetical protein